MLCSLCLHVRKVTRCHGMASVALRSLSDRQYTCCTASFFLILPANPSLRLEVQVVPRREWNEQTSQCSLSSRARCLPRTVSWSHPLATPCSWDITPAKNPGCDRIFLFPSGWVETNNYLCPGTQSTGLESSPTKDPRTKCSFRSVTSLESVFDYN